MSETADIELSKGSQIRALIPSGQRGVELRSLDDFYRFAQYVWAANMVPNGITNVEGVLIAMQRGAEVGLLPMQSLQSIYIVHRQPHLFGDAPKAIVEASGLLEGCREYEEGKYPEPSYKWICKVKRRGRDWHTSEFSIADAQTAKLWGGKGNDKDTSPWVLYPKRMLLWRARGYALRDEFADVLKGFPIRELSDSEDAALAAAKPLREAFASASVLGEPTRRGRGRPPKEMPPEVPRQPAERPGDSGDSPHEVGADESAKLELPLHEQLLERLKAAGFTEAEMLAVMVPRKMAKQEASSLSQCSIHHLTMCLEDWDAALELLKEQADKLL